MVALGLAVVVWQVRLARGVTDLRTAARPVRRRGGVDQQGQYQGF